MSADHSSLISFLAAPVLVVDPEGHIIYANPAFASQFASTDAPLQGEDLATVFAGESREAVLVAVAAVCASGSEERFQLVEGGQAYRALASPIESSDSRVGVMVLLIDEPHTEERLLGFHGQILERIDEVMAVLEELFEQTGGRRAAVYRTLVERGMVALQRVRKWSDELHEVLVGNEQEPGGYAPFAVDRLVREVVGAAAHDFADAGVELDLLVPGQLPAVRGDAASLELALEGLLRERLEEALEGDRVTVTARPVGESKAKAVLLSVVDACPGVADSIAEEGDDVSEPEFVRAAVHALGGRMHTIVDPIAGRVTAIRLRLAD